MACLCVQQVSCTFAHMRICACEHSASDNPFLFLEAVNCFYCNRLILLITVKWYLRNSWYVVLPVNCYCKCVIVSVQNSKLFKVKE